MSTFRQMMAKKEMQRKLKIIGGTRGGERLCDSCSHAVIMKGPAESEEVVICQFVDKTVRMKVVECNQYRDKSEVPLHRMEETAWILKPQKGGRGIGFAPPRQKNEYNFVIDDDD